MCKIGPSRSLRWGRKFGGKCIGLMCRSCRLGMLGSGLCIGYRCRMCLWGIRKYIGCRCRHDFIGILSDCMSHSAPSCNRSGIRILDYLSSKPDTGHRRHTPYHSIEFQAGRYTLMLKGSMLSYLYRLCSRCRSRKCLWSISKLM
jgi:hypothetical protein